jgi:hypothetical protein
MLEKIKRRITRFERTYTTNVKGMGFGINQFLFVGAIVFLPSLESLSDRAILIVAILALIFGVNWLHCRNIPFAAIYLGAKPVSLLTRTGPIIISWLISATAAVAATMLAAFLQGWLALPI